MERFQFTSNDIPRLRGIALKYLLPGQSGEMITKDYSTSDDKRFFRYIDQFSAVYLGKFGIPPGAVLGFIALTHQDGSGTVFVNPIVKTKILSKRDFKSGEPVSVNDVLDVAEVRFCDIQITPSDSVVICWKVGWKFALYFDFRRPEDEDSDVSQLYSQLGRLHTGLIFKSIYDSVSTLIHFGNMMKDGWFPFADLLVEDYERLNQLYEDEASHEFLEAWLKRFKEAYRFFCNFH